MGSVLESNLSNESIRSNDLSERNGFLTDGHVSQSDCAINIASTMHRWFRSARKSKQVDHDMMIPQTASSL
jgi:hypothetical protein